MADIAPTQLREKCERRLTGLKENRRNIEGDWKDVAQYFPPRRGKWLCERPDQGDRANSKLLNGAPARASNVLANGMFSGLTSPSRPWFRLTTTDPDLRENTEVRAWLTGAQKSLYELFAATNFYNATHGGYKELGLFGIEAAIFTSHWQHRGVVHQLTAGEYWVGLSDALQPDTLYRRCPMTVAQLVQRFGDKVSKKVRDMYDRGDKDVWIPCFHAIEPNPERVAGKVDNTNMAFRSVYWEESSPKDELLDFSGFEQQPFWAPRWEVTGSGTYGTSPAMDALGDAKQLQLKEIRLQQAQDFVTGPALVAEPSMETALIRLQPRSVSYVPGSDRGAGVQPMFTVPPAALAPISQDIQRLEVSIERHFFADLFMAVSQMEGVQPRNQEEIAERVGEKMTQLGPVVERVQNEKLRIAVEIAWSILRKSNTLPPAPAGLQGSDLKLEFISMLAQMQRAAGLTAIERYAGFVSSLGPTTNGASFDKLDADQAADEYADILGVAPSVVRSDDAVAKLRQQRAQAQQAQAAAAAAGPALDASQAALNLSKTDIGGGENALQRMVGA